jgi:hypothetical protein
LSWNKEKELYLRPVIHFVESNSTGSKDSFTGDDRFEVIVGLCCDYGGLSA